MKNPLSIRCFVLTFSFIFFYCFQVLAQMQPKFPVEGIPITLSNTEGVRISADFPTHASIPLPKGMLHIEQIEYLKLYSTRFSTVEIPIQVEIIASWNEESNPSIKWVRIFFSSNITNGESDNYILKLTNDINTAIYPERLVVNVSSGRDLHTGYRLEQGEILTINNNRIRFTVDQDFKGVSSLSIEGRPVISGSNHTNSGPFLNIGEEMYYPDDSSIVIIETLGYNLVVIRAEGWYYNSARVPQHKFTTRIFAYSNSSNVKIQHATTFTKDMRSTSISSMGFNINRTTDTSDNNSTVDFGFEEGSFQSFSLGLNEPIFLIQESENTSRLIRDNENSSQSRASGWVNISSNEYPVSMSVVVKDFWQKYPNEIGVEPNKISLYFWPQHGRNDVFPQDIQLSLENVYKFLCFHQGVNLNLTVPEIYKTSLLLQEAGVEGAKENAERATARGISIFNEFDLVFGQTTQALSALQDLLDFRPIALPDQKWIANSKVFGEVSERVPGFDDIEDAIIDGPLNYSNPERGENYGKFNYGDTNHKWDLQHNSPELHRAWFNNHYHFGTSLWQTVTLRNNPEDYRVSTMLHRVRSLTDHYSSIDQCRDEADKIYIGAFWHGKAWLHWAGDLSTYKHWVDPGCLLLAWYIDDNRWAKDGYELFADNPNHYTSTANAIINTSAYSRDLATDIYNASTLVQYRPNPLLLSQIDSVVRLLLIPTSTTLPCCAGGDYFKAFCDDNNPFWQPLWLNKYLEVQQDPTISQRLIPYIVQNSTIDLLFSSTSLAFSAEAYRLTGDVNHLARHFYFLNKYPQNLYKNASLPIYHNFGAAPASLGDNHFPLQWPYFLKQLREAGFGSIPIDRESGYYPYIGSYNIFILKTHETPYVKLRFDVDQPSDVPGPNLIWHYNNQKLNFPTSTNIPFWVNYAAYTTTLRRSSLRRVGRFEEIVGIPTTTDSLLVVYGSGRNQALYMPINQEGFPEGIIMRSINDDKNSTFETSCTRGYLTPLYDVPMVLKISHGNEGIVNITIKDRNNEILVDNAILFTPIDTTPIIVNLPQNSGPFFIDIYGSYAFTNANVKLSVSLPDIRTNDPIMIFTRTKEEGEILREYERRHR